ncbi:MAG: MFS transporter [Pseudomonadota bacterium]
MDPAVGAAASAEGRSSALAPLYAANLVCSMGMTGFLVVTGPLADAIGLAAWQIALSAAAGGVGWVVAAPFWGWAADRLGRKRVLTTGLAGFAAGYALLCLAAHAGIAWGVAPILVLTAFIATRFFAGLSYSALPAAGAALIADRYAPEARAGAMGRLGASQSAGLLIGPALVGLVAGTSPTAPLLVLALAPAPALLFLVLRLPADGPQVQGRPEPLSLGDPRLLRPVLAAFATITAVAMAQIVVSFIALDRLDLPPQQATRTAASALFAVGIALIAAQLVISRLGWSPERLMAAGAVVAALGLSSAIFATSGVALVLAYAAAGVGVGWAFPSISAAAANAVEATEQGRAAGSVSTAMGIGAMIGPLLGGVLYDVGEALPFAAAAVAMMVVAGAAATSARGDAPR